MAVRQTGTTGAGNRRTWFVAACLLVLFVAALFLRAYWNLDAANPEPGTYVLSGGSDPYYHKRAIDAIQANGYQTLIDDPMLNYPFGSVNPNPPLYEWSVAVAGGLLQPFFGGSLYESTWQATIWSPAIFGALTIFPLYFIGKALFDRRAGLVAALLWTVSTSSIDATGVGIADHDGAVVLFSTLAFLFYIHAIQRFRGDGNWVKNWRDGGAVGSGMGRLFRERRAGFGYALLSGLSIAALALTWKGFPYVIGIMFVYAGLQMVIDHWRNRDSTGLWLATLIAMLVGVLAAYPYYVQANVVNFLNPVWYIIGAFVVAGIVLVPTRDLPTILVMPIALVVAILGALAAFFVFPDVARSLLYATVYFKQTRLYETIAEAHPADFSTILFGIGPLPFFLALVGWFVLAANVRKHPSRAILFTLVWGAIALYMAQSAVRFLFNAIPVFAVLAGFMTVWLIDWLDFKAIRKSLAANRGSSWQGFRRGVRPMHVIAVVLVALLFVFPSTMLAADAALPPESEARIRENSESQFVKDFMTNRMGAYGQGFIADYWLDGLQWLDQHNANITEPSERPGFLAWWDYGHWAIAIGRTPAVADNFQNGYEYAANFILSQNETAAVQLLAARLAPLENSDAQAALQAVGSADPAGDLEKLLAWEYVEGLTLDQSVELVGILEENTGKRIRYFAADVRMFPYDDPQTSSIEQSSIFYAPVTLKGDKPDDYVTTKINVGRSLSYAPDGHVTLEQYEELARDPIRITQAVGERLEYQEPFFNSMYWRAYVGTPVQPPANGQPVLGDTVLNAIGTPRPGFGLEHFRLVYSNDQLKILEYYPGAIVSGTVVEDGNPLSDVTVAVYDDAGRLLLQNVDEGVRATLDEQDYNVLHAQTQTGADGAFSLTAPFAMEGGHVTLIAYRDGVELGRTHLAITREEANARATFENVQIEVQRGSVEGIAFEDVDNNGRFDAANETGLANVTLTIGDRTTTTDAEGRYTLSDVSAGAQNVTVESDTYDVAESSSRVRVDPGATTTADIALVTKPATVSGILYADADDDSAFDQAEAASLVTVTFTADEATAGNTARTTTAFTQSGGNFTATLRPGAYVVTATYTDSVSGEEYTLNETLTVAVGEVREDVALRMVKAAE